MYSRHIHHVEILSSEQLNKIGLFRVDEYKCAMNYACSQLYFESKLLKIPNQPLPPNICITLKYEIKFCMDTDERACGSTWIHGNESNYESYQFPISTIYRNSMSAHIAVFFVLLKLFLSLLRILYNSFVYADWVCVCVCVCL